jgi:hypothetical protein
MHFCKSLRQSPLAPKTPEGPLTPLLSFAARESMQRS